MDTLTEPAAQALAQERRTTPVELLWDLVFVFSITQVTTLLARDLSWPGLGRAMIALALVWWAWSAFAWVTNAEDPASLTARVVLLVATVCVFLVGLSLPHAFGADGLLFATMYAAVRFLHLALYAHASHRGRASWRGISGFAITVAGGMALLVIGSALDSTTRTVLWAAAVVIDYAGPLLTRTRLRDLQQVAVTHFAERYSLFVIICLGESVVAIGVAAANLHLGVDVVIAAGFGLLITIALWWTYFDHFFEDAQARLRSHCDPVVAASDAYAYIHLVLVTGIIILAVGARLAIQAPGAPLADGARLALCAGVALYLFGQIAFLLRMAGVLAYEKLAIGAALLALYGLGSRLPAWALMGVVAGLLAVLGSAEALPY